MKMQDLLLVLEKNPRGIFYKDEGGKSNYLSASVSVQFENANPRRESVPIGNLILVPRLIYENGSEIEDEGDIFHVLSTEPKTVTATNEIFSVNFRIEKVSRRKDGKRFKVRFDFDRTKTKVLSYINLNNLLPVETESVCVYSKRKTSDKEKCSHKSFKLDSNIPKPEPFVEPKTYIPSNPIPNVNYNSNVNNTHNINGNGSINNGNKITLPIDVVLRMRDSMLNLENRVLSLQERVTYLEGQQNCSSNVMNGQAFSPAMNIAVNRRRGKLGSDDNLDPELARSFENLLTCDDSGIKRNNSSKELLDFLTSSSLLN